MKLLKLIPVILLFVSCSGNNEEAKVKDVDSSGVADTVYSLMPNSTTSYEVIVPKGYYVWDVNVEKKTLKKNPAIVTADIDSIINGLNSQYESILLEKVAFKDDTLHLKISNSEYLTNQMGSSGPNQYIAQSVINLVSVPGVKYVHIDFKEGSHAAPGTWSRKDFPGYIIVP